MITRARSTQSSGSLVSRIEAAKISSLSWNRASECTGQQLVECPSTYACSLATCDPVHSVLIIFYTHDTRACTKVDVKRNVHHIGKHSWTLAGTTYYGNQHSKAWQTEAVRCVCSECSQAHDAQPHCFPWRRCSWNRQDYFVTVRLLSQGLQ